MVMPRSTATCPPSGCSSFDDHAEDRGLAGAVRARRGRPSRRGRRARRVEEEDLLAVLLGDGVEANHGEGGGYSRPLRERTDTSAPASVRPGVDRRELERRPLRLRPLKAHHPRCQRLAERLQRPVDHLQDPSGTEDAIRQAVDERLHREAVLVGRAQAHGVQLFQHVGARRAQIEEPAGHGVDPLPGKSPCASTAPVSTGTTRHPSPSARPSPSGSPRPRAPIPPAA